jgi:ketosteroid isomerase-like protein
MYRTIVKSKLTAVFAGLNAGHIEKVTREFAPDARHYFIGSHALSGTRSSSVAIRLWYERLLRLMPDIHFDLQSINVEGPPWRTLAVVRWTETNTGTDGVRARNEGVNVICINWGKVKSVSIYTDTTELVRTLDRLATKGVQEAQAAPIVD